MAKATKQAPKAKATNKLVVTQEHLDANPDLVEQGIQVGDEIEIPVVSEKKHYQEWKCEIKSEIKDGVVVGKSVEKLKLVRECVKITDAEAEVLNAGVKDGSSSIASMYFKAE
jgi:hypothetical protein